MNPYFLRHFQPSRTDMSLLRYSTKCVGQNASGSSHPTWNQNRENTPPPTSEESVAFAWIHTFQDTFNLQEQTWGCWDIQQNVSAKMHLVPVIQLEIKIARTRRHQLLRNQSHLPESILSKTLSTCKNRHEVVALRLSRYPTKWVGHNGFSKSSRSIWISAWQILCGFLATTIEHLAFLPSHCLSWLYACHSLTIIVHHCYHLMKMTPCLQCVKLVVAVLWYYALLNVKNNCAIFKNYEWVLSLLVFVILPCTLFKVYSLYCKMNTCIALKFFILVWYTSLATRLASTFVTCFGLKFVVLFVNIRNASRWCKCCYYNWNNYLSL